MSSPEYDIVIPTTGRATLFKLLQTLAAQTSELQPRTLFLVDDRRSSNSSLERYVPEKNSLSVKILVGPSRGPAAARNLGWRSTQAPWVVFLDDDVVPAADWAEKLAEDITGSDWQTAGVQGRIKVPLSTCRRPTDWERNTLGLENSHYITADMAFRKLALEAVGGFDERFKRAFREDAEIALRLEQQGWQITRGRRQTLHPVRPSSRWVSLRAQAGNADDVLMLALHGASWRDRAHAPRGRLRRHIAVTTAGLGALLATTSKRKGTAKTLAAAWLAGTGELAWHRIAPGPRTLAEITTMTSTSLAMPPTAAGYWLWGWLTLPWRLRTKPNLTPKSQLNGRAVLLDRDGTLVVDVPYNGDPQRVEVMPGAQQALKRLRDSGVPLAVVSNQSGIGRGLVTTQQVEAVNRRIEELIGPLGLWLFCPHTPESGCKCRKPKPGLVFEAARRLGVNPKSCVVIGDIAADMAAAEAAGAKGILVPNQSTKKEEVTTAATVVPTLAAAAGVALEAA